MSSARTTHRFASRMIARGAALALAAAMLLGAGTVVPFTESPAGASASGAVSVACNAAQPRAIGHFLVSCSGSASTLVKVTASLAPCTSAAACATSSGIQYVVSAPLGPTSTGAYTFTGGSVSQVRPLSTTSSTGIPGNPGSSGAAGSTGAAGTTTTQASTSSGGGHGKVVFHDFVFRFTMQARGRATKVLDVTVSAAAKFGLSNPVLGIQDNKNVADGAAKSQAVE